MASVTFAFDVNLQRIKLKSSTESKSVVASSNNLYYVHVDFSPLWKGAVKKVVLEHRSKTDTSEDKQEYTWTGSDIQIPASYYGSDTVGSTIRVSVYGQTAYEAINLKNYAVLTVEKSETTVINPPVAVDNNELYVKTPNTATKSAVTYIKKDETEDVLFYWDEDKQVFIPVRDAYRAAVKGGYTGTETQFYEEISGIADSAATVAQIENKVKTIETNVREYATVVTNAAETANQAAEAAEDSAQTAQDSATAANQAAGAAADTKSQIESLKSQTIEDMDEYAVSALNSQNAAEQSATSASQSMSLASRSATEAANSATEAAQTVASTVKYRTGDPATTAMGQKPEIGYTSALYSGPNGPGSYQYLQLVDEDGNGVQLLVSADANNTTGTLWYRRIMTGAGAWYELARKDDLYSHIDDTSNPHGVTKAQVGLENVDNTSDLDKPISTAAQIALETKADFTQQLRDSCSGKAMIDYASAELTASHAGAAYETVFAPMLKTVGTGSAFSGCAGLKQLYLPSLENTGESTFLNCTSLTEVYLPSIKTVGSNAFEGCSALTTVDLGRNVTSIGAGAFRNCTAMNVLVLRAPTVVTMVNSNAVVGTVFAKGAGSIYVPDALVQDYKAATNWVYYKSQIKPLSALEE